MKKFKYLLIAEAFTLSILFLVLLSVYVLNPKPLFLMALRFLALLGVGMVVAAIAEIVVDERTRRLIKWHIHKVRYGILHKPLMSFRVWFIQHQLVFCCVCSKVLWAYQSHSVEHRIIGPQAACDSCYKALYAPFSEMKSG